MVKPTREEILKYIKNPIVRKDKNKIKKEKKINKLDAVTFINTVNLIIKDLGNIEGLSVKELNDKIDLLLVTPPPLKSRSFSPTPTEEEDTKNFRNAIRKQHEAAVRAKERKLGLKKGALKVGSIEFPDNTGYGIKKKSAKKKKKSAKKKGRKSLGKKSKKKNKKKSKKSGRRRGKRSVKRRGKRSGRSSRRR